MSLPGITAPTNAPLFLADGHAIEEQSVYSAMQPRVGPARLRRVRTVLERVVSVAWFLEADEMLAVEAWYEDVLQAGALEFAALVANQGSGQLWWRARWISFQTEMLHKGRGKVTGTLLLTGTGTTTPPDTSTLEAEISVALQSQAEATIPVGLAAEIVIALVANSANTLLNAEIAIALDGAAEQNLTLLLADVAVPLDGSATPTIAAGACSPFAVLGDTGLLLDASDAITPLASSGESFDACRALT